jgi:phosphatidylserine/phosphatidylglycerophosphate/cardiolipin synthase-like enzyme
MHKQALAIANNDLVYLWWTYSEKIDGCLGFTVRRLQAGKQPRALPAFVGFDAAKPPPVKHPTTDYWPIQSYQWKDLFVPEETEVSYEIVPVTGTPGKKLLELPGLSVRTNRIEATDRIGRHRVVFNRGIISTQALSRSLPSGPSGTPSDVALRKHIGIPGDPIRNRLAGEAIELLKSLFERARIKGGTCYCALYELTDRELVDAIKQSAGSIKVLLANADSTEIGPTGKQVKVYDGTNAATRTELRAALGAALVDRLLARGSYIGHNKFVVYVDAGGVARIVLTGSTNWTSTGLCAQSNNIVVFDDDAIAARYLDYWNRLVADEAKQAPVLRSSNAVAPPDLRLGAGGAGGTRIWFSPNTKQRTKPKHPAAPGDMSEVFQAISEAKHGILFLLFSAGAPSILQHLTDVSRQRVEAHEQFFVRGAISDAKTSRQFTTRVYNDGLLNAPNRLITGIGGITDQFSFWEKELAKLGHAVIHDKTLVVDPFTDDSVVVTGSHNLGYKASYSNDENMCIIRGNRRIAQAYAAHVLDVVNHYNWRNKLVAAKQRGKPPAHAFTDLDESGEWQSKYFRGSFLASRDQFFFPAS